MWIIGQQLWNGLVAGMAYSLVASGLTLIFGIMKVANLAHGEFYMLGAMFVWVTISFLKINFFLAFLVSVFLVGLLGVGFYLIALKPLIDADPNSTMLSTMAVGFIFMYGAQIMFGADSRFISTPITGSHRFLRIAISNSTLMLFILGIFVLFGVYYFLSKTKIGKMMRATSQDKIGASLVGIDIKKIYAISMALAAGLAAVAGGIMGPIWVAHPRMGQEVLLKGFAIVVIGGMGNLKGATLLGFFLGLTEALFAQYVSMYYGNVYVFGIMILMLLIKSEGLFKQA